MDITVVSTVAVVPPRNALITGSVDMIAPEFPAAGWVVKERKEEVDPETVISGDVAVREPSVATSVKLVPDDAELARVIVQRQVTVRYGRASTRQRRRRAHP